MLNFYCKYYDQPIIVQIHRVSIDHFIFTGNSLHIHSSVSDCVLFAASGNYSTYITRSAIAWQIPPIYHDFGYTIDLRNRWGSQCSL